MTISKQKTLSIYGVGGFGVNMVMGNINIPVHSTGFSNTEYHVIDTSRSNIVKQDQDGKVVNTYIISGLDGQGKDRKYGYGNIEPHIDKILIKHKPKDFCIVLFSLSGGTGSIGGVLLLAELKRRGIAAIGICVGSMANGKEAINTVATINSLQNLSVNVLDEPLICDMYINGLNGTRTEIDNRVENNVRALSLLVSGTNIELDSNDLANWINYPKVTDVPPQLIDLVIHTAKSDTAPPDIDAISVASLLPSQKDTPIELGQVYGCMGYLPSAVVNASNDDIEPMHFILTNGLLNERMDILNTAVDNFNDNANKLKLTPMITPLTTDNPDGMIF